MPRLIRSTFTILDNDPVAVVQPFALTNDQWSAVSAHINGTMRVEVSDALDLYLRGRRQADVAGSIASSNADLKYLLDLLTRIDDGAPDYDREFLDLVIDDLGVMPTDRLHAALRNLFGRKRNWMAHRGYGLGQLRQALVAATSDARGFLPNRDLTMLVCRLTAIYETATGCKATHRKGVGYSHDPDTTAGRFIMSVIRLVEPTMPGSLISRAMKFGLQGRRAAVQSPPDI